MRVTHSDVVGGEPALAIAMLLLGYGGASVYVGGFDGVMSALFALGALFTLALQNAMIELSAMTTETVEDESETETA